MPRSRPFQGAGARGCRGPGGVDVVEDQDEAGDPPSPRDPEGPFHVPPSYPDRKTRLGGALPVPQQEEGVEVPPEAAGEAGPDESGEVASPPEIFPWAYGNRNDRRSRFARDQVPPRAAERVPQAVRHRRCREWAAGVLCRQDGGPHVPRVEEQGAGGVERRRDPGAGRAWSGEAGCGQCEEIAAPGAAIPFARGPPPHRRRGEVRRHGGEKVPETGRFRGDGTKEVVEAPRRAGSERKDGGGDGRPRSPVSGGWRIRRTPGSRGRWRIRSMCRRKDTGRSTGWWRSRTPSTGRG